MFRKSEKCESQEHIIRISMIIISKPLVITQPVTKIDIVVLVYYTQTEDALFCVFTNESFIAYANFLRSLVYQLKKSFEGQILCNINL